MLFPSLLPQDKGHIQRDSYGSGGRKVGGLIPGSSSPHDNCPNPIIAPDYISLVCVCHCVHFLAQDEKINTTLMSVGYKYEAPNSNWTH